VSKSVSTPTLSTPTGSRYVFITDEASPDIKEGVSKSPLGRNWTNVKSSMTVMMLLLYDGMLMCKDE
jgi:hypothetical protein